MAHQAVSPGVETTDDRRSLTETARLLRSALSQTLLGERQRLDFYARNGFRLLSVPAWLDPESLASRCQQFRSLVRIDPARARRLAIQTVSDEHLDAETILATVGRLESPRHRFCAELFWPHVQENEFAAIRKAGGLGSAAVLQQFRADGRRGVARIHSTHLRAIGNHCLAIEEEVAHLSQGAGEPKGHWEAAIAGWREVFGSDEFWQYMTGRAEKLDDPRLRKEDAEAARAEVPRLILGVHELFVEKYADHERYADCVRHLKLIADSGLPDAMVRSSTWNAVKKVAGSRLDDLCKRTKQSFEGSKERVDRAAFELKMAPFLIEAQAIREIMVDRLKISDSLLEQSAFDDFAQAVREATGTKLIYDGPERERNILYSSLFVKRLLMLPLSSAVRRAIEQSIENDNRILYSPFGLDRGAFPSSTECYFVRGAEADPDKSILLPVWRFKERKVEVDRVRGSAGISVTFEARTVLIPRSRQAAGNHGNKVDVAVAPSEYTEKQRQVSSELTSLEERHRASQMELKNSRDAQIQKGEAQDVADLQVKEAAIVQRSSVAKSILDRLTSEEQKELAVEAQAMETGKRGIETKHESAIGAARSHQASVHRSVVGGRGIVRIELPAVAVFLLLLWIQFGFGSLAVTGAVFCALGTGQVVRVLVRRKAGSRLLQAESAREAEIQRVREAFALRSEDMRQKFAQKRKEPQGTVDGASKEISQMHKACQDKIANTRKQWDKKLADAEEAFQQRAKALRQQLVRSEQVKREAQAREFPAYAAARARGFKDGEKPSSSDMDMTPSERALAIMQLRG